MPTNDRVQGEFVQPAMDGWHHGSESRTPHLFSNCQYRVLTLNDKNAEHTVSASALSLGKFDPFAVVFIPAARTTHVLSYDIDEHLPPSSLVPSQLNKSQRTRLYRPRKKMIDRLAILRTKTLACGIIDISLHFVPVPPPAQSSSADPGQTDIR